MTETLFTERKLAIMQIKQGKTQKEVAHSLNRSTAWVAKWHQRFKRKGWPGLKDESRAPKTMPNESRQRSERRFAGRA